METRAADRPLVIRRPCSTGRMGRAQNWPARKARTDRSTRLRRRWHWQRHCSEEYRRGVPLAAGAESSTLATRTKSVEVRGDHVAGPWKGIRGERDQEPCHKHRPRRVSDPRSGSLSQVAGPSAPFSAWLRFCGFLSGSLPFSLSTGG